MIRVSRTDRRLKPSRPGLVGLMALMALLLVWPGSARARIVDFELYTVDVPGGWSITDEDGIVTLTSADRRVVFLITVGLSTTHHKKKIEPELRKYGHILMNNPERFVTLLRIPGKRVAVSILGDHPDRTKVYYSIKEKRLPKWDE